MERHDRQPRHPCLLLCSPHPPSHPQVNKVEQLPLVASPIPQCKRAQVVRTSVSSAAVVADPTTSRESIGQQFCSAVSWHADLTPARCIGWWARIAYKCQCAFVLGKSKCERKHEVTTPHIHTVDVDDIVLRPSPGYIRQSAVDFVVGSDGSDLDARMAKHSPSVLP